MHKDWEGEKKKKGRKNSGKIQKLREKLGLLTKLGKGDHAVLTKHVEPPSELAPNFFFFPFPMQFYIHHIPKTA